jgi:hypothetical protein
LIGDDDEVLLLLVVVVRKSQRVTDKTLLNSCVA